MKKQCSASLPNADGDEDYSWCSLPSGHAVAHTDGERSWQDTDYIEVTTVTEVRAVPDHQHGFVGDEDTCVRDQNCPLTWGDHLHQTRLWKAEH